jgi:C4-type Zn-finger protein
MPKLKESEVLCGVCEGSDFRIIANVEESEKIGRCVLSKIICSTCGRIVDKDQTMGYKFNS